MKRGVDYVGVSAGAMILNDKGEVFLSLRSQNCKNEKGHWETPGGSVEFGETLEQCVRREMMEECGVKIEIIEQFPAADHFIPKEGQHWVATTFLCKLKPGQAPKIMEPEKCDQIDWFALDNLPKPLSLITIADIKEYKQRTNMTDEQEQATIQTYDTHAESWANGHSNRTEYKLVVARLQKLLSRGSILEVGAGGGSDAELLSEAGYKYFGTDASAGMVRAARTAHPGLKFEHASVYELTKLGRQFDGFWACAVLLHIPKKRIDEALQAIAAVTKPGGVGFISMKDGDREEFEEREVSGRTERRIFAYWRKDEFEKVLRAHGFTVLDYEYVPVSQRTNWHRFIVRKGA